MQRDKKWIISVKSPPEEDTMPRTRRSNPGDSLWLSPAQQRAWVTYMRVQLRMNYEINRQLQRDSGPSRWPIITCTTP
jgi:hypothetical protein